MEQIIALQPDVVLAPFSGMSAQAYAQLSRFVPVVAYPEHPFLTPMDTQIDLIAAALGKRAEATRSRPASPMPAARAHDNPQLAGKTFAYVRADLGSGNFATYVAGDPRVDTISAMGLALAPSVRQLRASAGHFAHYLSSMPTGWRRRHPGVLVLQRRRTRQDGGHAALAAIPAVQRGAYVALSDPSLVMASSSGAAGGGVDADRLAPQLAAALRPPRHARESMMHRHAKVTFVMHRPDSRRPA